MMCLMRLLLLFFFDCDVFDASVVAVCLFAFDVRDVCDVFVVVCCLRLMWLMIWLVLLLLGFDFDVVDDVGVVVCVLRVMWLILLLLLLVLVCCF